MEKTLQFSLKTSLVDATGKMGAFPGTAQLQLHTAHLLTEATGTKTLFDGSDCVHEPQLKAAANSGKKKLRVWIPSLEVT